MKTMSVEDLRTKKHSDLLELAVRDARAVAKRQGVVLSMNALANDIGDGKCYVCMAGAVMLQSLGMSPDTTETNACLELYDKEGSPFAVINNMRFGLFDSVRSNDTAVLDVLEDARALIKQNYDRKKGRASWETYLRVAKMLRSML